MAVERIFFLGDVVGYFPNPVPAIELLRSVEAVCLLGNHDAMLTERLKLDKERDVVYLIEQSKRNIPRPYMEEMMSWLPYLQLHLDDKKILMVHGSPWNPLTDYIYPDADLRAFSRLPYDVVFMGHTHRPFIRKAGRVLVVNVGSCGLPRDQGNLASCAVYDTKTGECTIQRLPFDADGLINRYGDTIHPSVVSCLRRRDENLSGYKI